MEFRSNIKFYVLANTYDNKYLWNNKSYIGCILHHYFFVTTDNHQCYSNIFKSSAYNNYEHAKFSGSSFIYGKNNKGPKFDLWGTSNSIYLEIEIRKLDKSKHYA